MKNHEYYFELVSLKIDNMLTAEQEAELEDHLPYCSECRDRLVMYRTIREMAEDLLAEPPASLVSGVMNKVELEKKERMPKQRFVSRILTFAGAAAAVALLLYTGVSEGLLIGGVTSKDSATMQFSETSMADEDLYGEREGPMSITAEAVTEAPVATDDSSAMAAPSNKTYLDGADASVKSGNGRSLYYGNDMPKAGSNLFDPATAKVGDEVAGFKITEVETEYDENTRDARVVFDGEVTLSGTLYYDNNEEGYWGRFIYFYIDDDCAGFLPYPVGDDRQIWFGVENYDGAVEMLDIQPEDEGKTIEYQAVIVIDSYTVVLGSSEGCNFASLKSILTLNRIAE